MKKGDCNELQCSATSLSMNNRGGRQLQGRLVNWSSTRFYRRVWTVKRCGP